MTARLSTALPRRVASDGQGRGDGESLGDPYRRGPPCTHGPAELLGRSGKPAGGPERGSSGPNAGFAGLSSTIRGHSHPTMEGKKGARRRRRPLPHTAAAITGFHNTGLGNNSPHRYTM